MSLNRTPQLLLTAGLLTLLTLSLLPATLALPSSATGLTVGTSSRRNLTTSNTTSVDALAGNVTRLDINGLSITTSWQGYYGNISGNVILADAQNYSMYEWGNGTSISGEVYASRNDTIDWANIQCANSTIIAAEESYLGQSSGDSDSVTNTFNSTSHPSFFVGTTNLTGCPSTNAWTSGAQNASNWHQILLADPNDKVVYTTIIDHGATGFDGETHDFQLLVGENGKNGDTSTTTYYFYTELGA